MMVTSEFTRVALLVLAVLMPLASPGLAQPPARPKRVLVLHWYDRNDPVEIQSDQNFQAAMESAAPGGFEYYSEYLESNKFPGAKQPVLLRDYLRQKYAGIAIDAVVVQSGAPLDFLLKYRSGLFPHTPIVFATAGPAPAGDMAEAGATGLVYASSYRATLDLALRLHPGTQQIFIISGSVNHEKSFEAIARQELQGYKDNVAITYLTDLTPEDLLLRLRNPLKKSIALYAWQQALDRQGKLLQTRDFLALIAKDSRVPIYGMSFANVGQGIVGGYVWTLEAREARLAALTLKVSSGTRAADIPIEKAPEIPMFDGRQLQRWAISEDRLPPGSVIRYREATFWQQYRGRIAASIAIFALQALLIGALLVQRHGARRSREELEEYKLQLEDQVQKRTAELLEARDQALAANRSKSTFLANMSHELRTPLNAILGFSGMMLTDASLSEEHRKDLAIVGSSGEHLLGLIDDVLDLAKIETGGAVVDIASIDLHSLVNGTVNMLREHARAKNLELLIDVSPQAPRFIRSDPGKLRQVLTNLIANAVKYTDEGSVVVRLDAKPGDAPSQLALILDVEDTGVGIAKEDQARIFDPFVQTRSARKGTGLGLSISRQFVQLLGGTIQVDSTPGRGSRFHVELPAQTADASEVIVKTAHLERVSGLEPGQPDYRILVVEDRPENWMLMQMLLQAAGFRVQVAEDGGQAVEAFRMWRPHFIWMDLRLPVMSGLEAAGRIRELEGGRDVKIAAVTASAFASQREEVLSAGFDDFLRKPYRHMEIFECMARHLGVRYTFVAGPPTAAGDLPATLRPEDLAALPAALRDELEHAVISLDPKRIGLLVCQVSEQDASLGNRLGRLADKFAYTSILNALEAAKQDSPCEAS